MYQRANSIYQASSWTFSALCCIVLNLSSTLIPKKCSTWNLGIFCSIYTNSGVILEYNLLLLQRIIYLSVLRESLFSWNHLKTVDMSSLIHCITVLKSLSEAIRLVSSANNIGRRLLQIIAKSFMYIKIIKGQGENPGLPQIVFLTS